MALDILTGSGEFFAKRKDTDYVCFRNQPEFFKYIRDDAAQTDYFCYRDGITKAQLWHWHEKINTWWLNFAPLITKGYLAHLGIDLLGEDRDEVYRIMHKVFTWRFRMPNAERYDKMLYRVYIYTAFMGNDKLELTRPQLQNAYDFYRFRYPDRSVIRSMYDFFAVDPEETEIGMEQVFGELELTFAEE